MNFGNFAKMTENQRFTIKNPNYSKIPVKYHKRALHLLYLYIEILKNQRF